MPSKSQMAFALLCFVCFSPRQRWLVGWLGALQLILRGPGVARRRKREERWMGAWKEKGGGGGKGDSRARIDLVQEPSSVLLGKHAGEAPRLVLERLDVHDLDEEHVARLRALHVKGPAEVVYLGEVHILDIVGRVVVPNLAAGP